MENKKKIIMVVLSVLVCVMAVGYAVLSQQLNINGTASIDSTWRVEITNITERDKVGDATSKVAPSYTATTANFSVGLTQPGDSITYDIEVSNLGTLDARVGSINVTLDENDAITYTTSGIKTGDSLKVNEKDILTITVAYNPEITSQPADTNKELSVTINYVQDLGENTPITYATYSIGDVVSFAGSDWRVIKNSSSEEDYVTLMKEKTLTHEELAGYGIEYNCDTSSVYYNTYGCTYDGEIIELDAMAYNFSDTCHGAGYNGYTDYNSSGCTSYYEYNSSRIRNFLEGNYVNTLGVDNLKWIDGYQIRIITLEELQALGYATKISGYSYKYDAENTPLWVYKNFGELELEYWTMHTSGSYDVWFVRSDGEIAANSPGNFNGVRPVINLLKSSI